MTKTTNVIVFICVWFAVSCHATDPASQFILIGSTPGDSTIKSALSIPHKTQVDFIKWRLELRERQTFLMNIHYGESQPNTLGFLGDGERLTVQGTYSVVEGQSPNEFREVYQFNSNNLADNLIMVKVTENLFHFLDGQNHLMVGNGGWSYMLSREDPIENTSLLISSAVSDESTPLVFVGRTPCQEFALEHPEMNVSPACFKLKWKLVLNRDPLTNLPSTCVMRKIVDNQPREVTGRWTILRGAISDPESIIYQIDFDEPGESISLLAGDDNILFFLDKNDKPFVGNQDFSFVLNRDL